VHGDLNEGNIIVQKSVSSKAISNPNDVKDSNLHYDVIGVLDFGDLVHEYLVYEIGITMAYMMIESKDGLDPLEAGGHVLAGYLHDLDLLDIDRDVTKECVCARLAQSLLYGAMEHKKNPDNQYCLKTSVRGWPLLRLIWGLSKNTLYEKWNAIITSYGIAQTLNL